jgi:hypothetical protein
MASVGEELFAAQVEFARAEARMTDLLDSVLGCDSWEGIHFDYYDASIEVYAPGCDEVDMTNKLVHGLVGHGVHAFYLHPHEQSWCRLNRDLCMRTTRRRGVPKENLNG